MNTSGERPRSFGVEEEYLLLDHQTGVPVNSAADLILAMPELQDRTEREFLSSQIETATPVCTEAAEAEDALASFRSAISSVADDFGVVVAGTGLPPVGGDVVATVTPKPRYELIKEETRSVATHQYSTGTHVHIEVPSREAGVEVIARIARWMPAVLALSANSPLWCGEATGFASWRHVMSLTWPAAGFPAPFKDADHYERTVQQLISTGIVPDAGMLSWVIRLSHAYPTVELRIADAQLTATDAVALAVIARALVERAMHDLEAGIERPPYAPGIVNGANWLAARNGLSSKLVDPLATESVLAFDLVDRMLDSIAEPLERFGDRDRVDCFISRLRERGNSASRQLAVFEARGIDGLLALFRETMP